MKAEIRRQGIEYKSQEQEQQKMFAAASILAGRFQGHIPDEFYEFSRSQIMNDFQQRLKNQGSSLDEYLEQSGMGKQQFGIQVMLQVRETLRQSFALDALARHLKLKLSEDDREKALSAMAKGKEDQLLQQFEGSGRMYVLDEAALRIKANQWLVDTATFEYVDVDPETGAPIVDDQA
jgi:trigger factor